MGYSNLKFLVELLELESLLLLDFSEAGDLLLVACFHVSHFFLHGVVIVALKLQFVLHGLSFSCHRDELDLEKSIFLG